MRWIKRLKRLQAAAIPLQKKNVAIPSPAALVFLPNFQLVRVKLCFCMRHLVNELRNNEKMGISLMTMDQLPGVCFLTISWCSQLIGVFYQIFYPLYSTQIFLADTSWRLISPHHTAFIKVFVVVFLERWLSTSKHPTKTFQLTSHVPIGWPSNPCVLGARPARMQPEKR